MADLSVQTFDETGQDLTMSSAASGGDQFDLTGQEYLIIHNGDTSSKDVTVNAQVSSFDDEEYGESVKQDQTLTVGAGSTAIMGPFPRKAFRDGNGKAQITYSAVTSLEVAVVKEE